MKVTVIGAGSTYTPELVNGFLERIDTFPLRELCLMDIDAERLKIVGGFAKRMVEHRGSPFLVTLSTDQRSAIAGASYVITQLRVGQMKARREDEYLGQRHRLIGQETTGIGGMTKALRTIPVLLKIAADIRETSPDALLVNFTNPSGLNTQALSLFAPDVKTVGVCNAAINFKMQCIQRVEVATGQKLDPGLCQLDTLGLNHLTWHRGFTVNGVEYWPLILDSFIKEMKQSGQPEFAPELVEALQMIPNYYLEYYYNTSFKLAAQQKWPPSRAEEVMEIEKSLLAEYADPKNVTPPADLMKRGGAYYSTVATQLLNAHYNDLGEIHIVNTVNAGAVKEWPADWVLELPCRVDKRGIHPLPALPLPEACFGLLAQVKAYEILTAQAAVRAEKRLLYQALLAHPLGPQMNDAQNVLDDLLCTNLFYLPKFK